MNRETDWGSEAVPLRSGDEEAQPQAEGRGSSHPPRFTLKRVTGLAKRRRGRAAARGLGLVVVSAGAIGALGALVLGGYEEGPSEAPIRIADPAPKSRIVRPPKLRRPPRQPEKAMRRARAADILEAKREPKASGAAPESVPPAPVAEVVTEEPTEPAPEAVVEPERIEPPADPAPGTPAATEFGIEGS